jgi:ankyrin repeat protein
VDSTAIVDLLIENGADVNAVNWIKQTPLFLCQSQIYSDIIDLLIDNGANVNAIDKAGETPLFHLVLCLPVIEQLFHRGAHVNVRNWCGQTPLHAAKRYHSIIQFLISNGADIEAADNKEQTPIHKAVQCFNFEGVMVLFEADANLFTVDEYGRSLLHSAVMSEPMTRFLIENGANVNAVDNDGETPLYLAALSDTLPSAMLLWEQGADLYKKDHYGDSAYDLCILNLDNPVNAVVKADEHLRRNEAFAMGSHSRLGAGSKVSVLKEDLLKIIIEQENK